jgi:hypothetical protein
MINCTTSAASNSSTDACHDLQCRRAYDFSLFLVGICYPWSPILSPQRGLQRCGEKSPKKLASRGEGLRA